MLTYTSGKCFVFDQQTFDLIDEFGYWGQGWGIDNDGKQLYMSDGSSSIKVINANDFSTDRIIEVQKNGKSLIYINELEFANGYLYANIWQSNELVKIDIKTGDVVAAYDLTELVNRVSYNPAIDVLNGIAYDKSDDIFYITGKLWPKLFKVKLGG